MGNLARRPDGKWRARYRDPAGRERSKHFDRKADAQRWLAQVEASKATADWIDPGSGRITFAEWAPTWLATKASRKAKTRVSYASALRSHVLPRWGDTRLVDITHADVVRWQAELADQVGPSLRRLSLLVLSQALTLAVRDGRLSRNVAQGVALPRQPAGKQRFLTHEQVPRLAQECAPAHDTLIYFLAYTGLRFGEMASLRVRDLDLDRRRVHVSADVVEISGRLQTDTPKNHRTRSVPVPRFLVPALSTLAVDRSPEALLFTTKTGKQLRNSNFRHHVFDAAVQRAGLQPLTPHDLRDTAVSLAVAAGANVKVVQRMLGHASAAMTLDIYAGLFDGDLDAVADRLYEAAARNADSVRTKGPEEDDASAGTGL
jgi:integrase